MVVATVVDGFVWALVVSAVVEAAEISVVDVVVSASADTAANAPDAIATRVTDAATLRFFTMFPSEVK